MMTGKQVASKVMLNGLLFLGIGGITFYMVFRSHHLGEMLEIMEKVNPMDILIGIGCMFLFLACEAMNIGRSLHLFHYTTNFSHCMRYALVGFFFSAVTPSAAGGQPMQLYFMQKDRISLSHGTLALLMEMASFQLVTVSMALIGLGTQGKRLAEMGSLKYVLWIGVLLNVCVLLTLLFTIFSKGIIPKVIRGLLALVKPFLGKRTDSLQQFLQEQVQQYQESAIYFKENKGLLVTILITTMVQIAAMHSVPFWIYRSFGLSGYSFWTVVGMQAILYIAVSALPLPGAMGVSEGGFLVLFQTLFPSSILSSAMLLHRGVSFYFIVLISGICVIWFFLQRKRRTAV